MNSLLYSQYSLFARILRLASQSSQPACFRKILFLLKVHQLKKFYLSQKPKVQAVFLHNPILRADSCHLPKKMGQRGKQVINRGQNNLDSFQIFLNHNIYSFGLLSSFK